MWRFCSILVVLTALSAPAFAAEPFAPMQFRTDRSHYAGPRYQGLVIQAYQGTNRAAYPFHELRGFYRDTRQFHPLGDQIMADLQTLYDYVQEGADEDALAAYKHFVDQHLGNLDVVLFARDKAAKDKRLGDAGWFEWLHRGLAAGLMNTAQGTNIGDAYVVQTMGEERYVLRRRGGVIIKSENLRAGAQFYNIYILRDSAGEEFPLYVDITIPMAYLMNREGRAPKALDLAR